MPSSSGGEYFQVSFAESEESEGGEDTDRPYFLIQRQFESYDGGLFYLESPFDWDGPRQLW